MKKNGFTLAEVLITLAIIGVVATLTLPSLMANTNEQQAMTGFKKLINTLSEAGQMNSAMNGYDYSSITGMGQAQDRFDRGQMTLMAIINDNMSINRQAGVLAGYRGGAGKNRCASSTMTLNDGTGLCIDGAEVTNDFVNIWVDTNGPKGPNRESTCTNQGCTGGKAEKHIYDQYPVVLYRGMAYPGHWAGSPETLAAGEQTTNNAAIFAMGVSQQVNAGSN